MNRLKPFLLFCCFLLALTGRAQESEAPNLSDDEIERLRQEVLQELDEIFDLEALDLTLETRRVGKNASLVDSLETYFARIGIDFNTYSKLNLATFWPENLTGRRVYSINGKYIVENMSLQPGRRITLKLNIDTVENRSRYVLHSTLELNQGLQLFLEKHELPSLEKALQEKAAERLNNIERASPKEFIPLVQAVIHELYRITAHALSKEQLEELRDLMAQDDQVEESLPKASTAFQVIFSASPSQRFGFDAYHYPEWNEEYHFASLGDGTAYPVPYKSMPRGGQGDLVEAVWIHPDSSHYSTDNLRFEDSQGASLSFRALEQGAQQRFEIQLPSYDTKARVLARYKGDIIGKLLIIPKKRETKRLRIVPLFEPVSQETSLEAALNAIYAPALISWSVTASPPFSPEEFNQSQTFGNPETHIMAKYTEEMKRLRDVYLQSHEVPRGEALIFIVPGFSDPGVQGYMPLGRSMGFIKANALQDEKTLAHELGHGYFGLEHTWENEGPLAFDTKNLMDYTEGGLSLRKTQWDQIHDHKPNWTLFGEAEEGAFQPYQYLVGSGITLGGKFSRYTKRPPPYSFVTLGGRVISLPGDTENLRFENESGVLSAFTLVRNGVKTRYAQTISAKSKKFAGYRENLDKTQIVEKTNLYFDELSAQLGKTATVYYPEELDSDAGCLIQLFSGNLSLDPIGNSSYAGGLGHRESANLSKITEHGKPFSSLETCLCDEGKLFFNQFSQIISTDEEFNQLLDLSSSVCELPDQILSTFLTEGKAELEKDLGRWLMWESDKQKLQTEVINFWKRSDAWRLFHREMGNFISAYHDFQKLLDDGAITNETLKAIINARTPAFLSLYSVEDRIDIIQHILPQKLLTDYHTYNFAELYVTDSEEHAILNVLKSVTTQQDALALTQGLSSKGFLRRLTHHIDDVGLGDHNFTQLANEFRRLTLLRHGLPTDADDHTVDHWKNIPPEHHLVYNDERTFSFGVPNEEGGVLYDEVWVDLRGEMKIVFRECVEVKKIHKNTRARTTFELKNCIQEETHALFPHFFDLISIDVITLEYVPTDLTTKAGESFITYAGFVDYLIEKKGTEQVTKIVEYTIDGAFLLLGVGEIGLLIKSGASLARIALASYDVGVEIADLVINSDAFAKHICGVGADGRIIKNCDQLNAWKTGSMIAQLGSITATGFDIGKNWDVLMSKGELSNITKKLRSRFDDAEWRAFDRDFGTDLEMLKRFEGDPGLVEAWKAVGDLPSHISRNTEVLSKLSDIAKRGRGIDMPKLKTALKGDLGDVMAKATGDDLTKMLNRMDAEHFNGSHLDEITSRLGNTNYGIKQDLIDNPGWFETFDDMLQNPGRYWERISQGELVNGSALQQWAQGKWWKDLRETAEVFQNTAGLNKVESIFGDIFGSQITLKVTKNGGESFEIVTDYLAKKDGVFHIIDTKYTTLDNFDLTKSFTPNQSKVFPWMKNGDDITIEIRAADSKLGRLNLLQGDMLDPGALKIDIYKSLPGNSSEVAPIINYK